MVESKKVALNKSKNTRVVLRRFARSPDLVISNGSMVGSRTHLTEKFFFRGIPLARPKTISSMTVSGSLNR